MDAFNQNQYNLLTVQPIEIAKIKPNPNQPRTVFNEDQLKELAESIKAHGVLQPITVRRLSMTEYELIAGERRLRASQLAGFTKIPAVIVRVTEEKSSILALIENIQRSDLNFFEEARSYKKLMDEYNMHQEQVAEMVGKSQPAVANKLRLLKLPENVQEVILKSGLSERHARALLKIDNPDKRDELLQKAVEGSLTVAQLEEMVQGGASAGDDKGKDKKKGAKKPNVSYKIKDVRIFINTVQSAAKVMKKSGVNVDVQENKTDDYYEMTIRVPFNNQ